MGLRDLACRPLSAFLVIAVTVVPIACSDSETSTSAAGGGGGSGGSAMTCDTAADCPAASCEASEAATTSCDDGTCNTSCDAGYTECTQCMTEADCTFSGDLCPPPNTDPNQNCFEGNCSEFCGAASTTLCLNDDECPLVQCPGGATAIAQCVGGGCMDASRRCCSM